MGTGCCFNRQALYGYDPVLTEEDLEPNIIIKSCCGSRKKGKSSNKKYIDKKRAAKRTESTIPIFNMEDIEEGVEGWFSLKVSYPLLFKILPVFASSFSYVFYPLLVVGMLHVYLGSKVFSFVFQYPLNA